MAQKVNSQGNIDHIWSAVGDGVRPDSTVDAVENTSIDACMCGGKFELLTLFQAASVRAIVAPVLPSAASERQVKLHPSRTAVVIGHNFSLQLKSGGAFRRL